MFPLSRFNSLHLSRLTGQHFEPFREFFSNLNTRWFINLLFCVVVYASERELSIFEFRMESSGKEIAGFTCLSAVETCIKNRRFPVKSSARVNI